MVTFNKLSSTSNREILDCFNHAFSDYSIPFKLNIQQLETKLSAENIDKEISVGAFREGKLVGFVLHGNRILKGMNIAYNGGTGVVPGERGKALTKKMYGYIFPTLVSQGFEKVILEVISNNFPAIKSYESIGFVPTRNLDCFKGELVSKGVNKKIKIEENTKLDLGLLSNFGEVKPSWQNSNESILNLEEATCQLIAYSGSEQVGYCIVNSSNNRIIQIAVHKKFRNKQIGSTLLSYIEKNMSKVSSIINVDSRSKSTTSFLESNNLKKFLSQIEMELAITNRADE